jgi:hypothetical protein
MCDDYSFQSVDDSGWWWRALLQYASVPTVRNPLYQRANGPPLLSHHYCGVPVATGVLHPLLLWGTCHTRGYY